jgi:acetyl-CoA carboxylase alpha subunit
MAKILKKHLKKTLLELQEIPIKELLKQRIEKYSNMGPYETLEGVPSERVVVFEND